MASRIDILMLGIHISEYGKTIRLKCEKYMRNANIKLSIQSHELYAFVQYAHSSYFIHFFIKIMLTHIAQVYL